MSLFAATSSTHAAGASEPRRLPAASPRAQKFGRRRRRSRRASTGANLHARQHVRYAGAIAEVIEDLDDLN